VNVARILLIGRTPATGASVANALIKHYPVTTASSGKSAINIALENPIRIVVLDAISMRTPGDRLSNELREALPSVLLVHLHPGPKANVQSRADVVLLHPVTARRLLNSIVGLLQEKSDDVLVCGPFTINRTRRLLIANGQETQLTPKQLLLIETFFTNPCSTLDRRTLMEKVWQTDYIGDTRTLDVHIRWVREMIEADPSHPQYLKTIRGVGYRLDIDNSANNHTSANLTTMPKQKTDL
jgi:DNA-binding response OmpR family regulator